jgi:hypothetical protein
VSSPQARGIVAVLAIVLAVALFFVLRGGDDDDEPSGSGAGATTEAERPTGPSEGADEPPQGPAENRPRPDREPEVATIVVRGGEPVGGVEELEFERGERIRFAVESDVADHVHLHTYDVFMDIAAGGRVEFDVPATIEGVFEVELEDRVVPLAEITVNPAS